MPASRFGFKPCGPRVCSHNLRSFTSRSHPGAWGAEPTAHCSSGGPAATRPHPESTAPSVCNFSGSVTQHGSRPAPHQSHAHSGKPAHTPRRLASQTSRDPAIGQSSVFLIAGKPLWKKSFGSENSAKDMNAGSENAARRVDWKAGWAGAGEPARDPRRCLRVRPSSPAHAPRLLRPAQRSGG